ncbi:hypothetical protein B0H17DRAFT_1205341 [Mycena rosella]|uniref:Uncharacterized protein n=1 Tax=Mycena rosella TaxID=1033263 RepID=A0AAD7D7A7_MYCRO|nr:hypothetical protein B0H17DRAFT_1205341 [Mycena rosella]
MPIRDSCLTLALLRLFSTRTHNSTGRTWIRGDICAVLALFIHFSRRSAPFFTAFNRFSRTRRAPSPYNVYIKENRESRVAAHPGRPRTDGMSAGADMWANAPDHPKRGQPVDKRAPWRREGAANAVPKAAASKKEESEEIQRSALSSLPSVYPAPAYHDESRNSRSPLYRRRTLVPLRAYSRFNVIWIPCLFRIAASTPFVREVPQ